MSIRPPSPPCGQYTLTRSADSPEMRKEAIQLLKNNGCRDWRFDLQPNGTVIVHGFLGEGMGQL